MDLFTVIPIIIAVGFVFIIANLFRGYGKYKAIPTFDEYRASNSSLVCDGKVQCRNCSGTNIFLKNVGNTNNHLLNFHICKSCGTTLYRSES